jgi:hypothetical protein
MSEEKTVNDFITISETGEVVIKDEKLAETIKKLSPEELEQLASRNSISTMNNTGCNTSCTK